jgi:hypothetical protein
VFHNFLCKDIASECVQFALEYQEELQECIENIWALKLAQTEAVGAYCLDSESKKWQRAFSQFYALKA